MLYNKTNKTNFLINNSLINILKKTKKIKKKIRKITIISSFTLNLLEPFLDYLFDEKIEIQFINYNEWHENLEDPKRILKFNPSCIFMFLHLQDLVPSVYLNLNKKNNIKKDINLILKSLETSISKFRIKSNIPIFMSNFINFYEDFQKYTEFSFNNSRELNFLKANIKLSKLINKFKNLYIFNYEKIIKNYGIKNFYNSEDENINLSTITKQGIKFLAVEIYNFIFSYEQKRKKIVVLDLDNTLWKGILGEDGVDNLLFDNSYPGNCYLNFQKYLLNLKNSGIILTIASKNNLADVKNFFKKRSKEMILKFNDFSAYEINWEDKYKSLIKISKKLNLGLDSFVFIDDSKFECDMINKYLPQVDVVCIGNKPEKISTIINSVQGLNYFNITKEDLIRSKFYASEVKRNILFNKNNKNSYLNSLKLKISISKMKVENLDRVIQLINRTNQFNLTTKRYNDENILNFLKDKNTDIFVVNLSDKFGNYGLISVFILKKKNKEMTIDTLLISCRALGRKVENYIIFYIENYALKNKINTVRGLYLKTPKNDIVKNFYLNFRYIKKKGFFEKKIIKKNLYKENLPFKTV